jgi:hypothetical protein
MFFNVFYTAIVLFTTICAVSGLAIPRLASRGAPATYDATFLESYAVYNARYLALGCENKHNSAFFDSCCHPLLAGESLSSRPAECTPGSATVTSNVAVASATSSDLPYCSEAPASSSEAPTQTPAAAAAAAPAPATPTTSSKTHTTHHSSTPAATATPAAAAGGSGGAASSETFTDGVATFFYQGGQAGACGTVHSDSDMIAAIDQARYGDSSVSSPLCGKQVHITNQNNGKSVVVTIADDCPTCNNGDSIDLSVGAFNQIATPAEGEVPISWYFL